MKNVQRTCEFSNFFYGSATIGERGQLVIPAEARSELGLEAGDKVLIMKHPVNEGLMVFKIDSVRGFLDEFQRGLDAIENEKDREGE